MKESSKSLKYICLFPDTFVVEGSSGALLISYGNKKMYEISSSVADLTKQFSRYTLAGLRSKFSELGDRLESYFDFLIKNQLAFYTNSPENYPAIEETYHSPSLIDNCIIEVGEKMDVPMFRSIIEQLASLGTEYMELRFYDAFDIKHIAAYVEQLDNSTIMGVELIIKYHESLKEESLFKLTVDSQRIAVVFVHSSPMNKYMSDTDFVLNNDLGRVFYTTQSISSHACCGQISRHSLSIGSVQSFVHNKKSNSCLSKKISIDLKGNIKNCPSLPDVYGHIDTDRLYDVVKERAFSKYWDITKDEIEVCRDCKYRYICTDCRAFRSDAENLYSKPAKCSYDPYTDIWEDVSKKSEGIVMYEAKK